MPSESAVVRIYTVPKELAPLLHPAAHVVPMVMGYAAQGQRRCPEGRGPASLARITGGATLTHAATSTAGH